MTESESKPDTKEVSIAVSVNQKNYVPSFNKHFKVMDIPLSDFEEMFSNANYSFIQWTETREHDYPCHRLESNFASATGLVLDVDNKPDESYFSIDAALDIMDETNLNYMLVTSRSHMLEKDGLPAVPKFHIIVPFDRPTTSARKYRAAYAKFYDLFAGTDDSVKDLARYLFGSLTKDEAREKGTELLYYESLDKEFFSIDSVNVMAQATTEGNANASQASTTPLGAKEDKTKADENVPRKKKKETVYYDADMLFTMPDKKSSLKAFQITEEVVIEQALNRLSKEEKAQLSKDPDNISPTIRNRLNLPLYDTFCDDIDSQSASAFISFTKSGRQYLYCSHCKETRWMNEDFESRQERIGKYAKNYFMLDKSIVKCGVTSGEFFTAKKNERNFLTHIGAAGEIEKEEALSYLYVNKDLDLIKRVDTLSDMDTNHDFYEFLDKTHVKVHIAPIPSKVQDNAFIEKYLRSTFGPFTDFIKQWMAVFTYENYSPLATFIFHGARGTSKSTFAEFVGEIFPSMCAESTGLAKDFTEEYEKKLIIIEENVSDAKAQYKTLKKIRGSEFLRVRKLYTAPYKVRNNLNTILLSNESIPMYVEKDEKPTDEFNNQFFVYELPQVSKKDRDSGIKFKLRDRLGHYIRTELLDVYNNIPIFEKSPRYTIPVPITEAEVRLFEDNTTNAEMDVLFAMDEIFADYTSISSSIFSEIDPGAFPLPANASSISRPIRFNATDYYLFKTGFITIGLIKRFLTGRTTLSAATKNLKKHKMIGDTDKKRMYGVQTRGYPLTKAFFEEFETDRILSVNNPNKKVQGFMEKANEQLLRDPVRIEQMLLGKGAGTSLPPAEAARATQAQLKT